MFVSYLSLTNKQSLSFYDETKFVGKIRATYSDERTADFNVDLCFVFFVDEISGIELND